MVFLIDGCVLTFDRFDKEDNSEGEEDGKLKV